MLLKGPLEKLASYDGNMGNSGAFGDQGLADGVWYLSSCALE